MKKYTFPCTIILLISMLFCLVGYNAIIIKRDSQKYQELQNKNEKEDKKEVIKTNTNKNQKTLYCIGDSLTLGSTSSSYPSSLSSLTNLSVNKYGGTNDQTIDIAIKMGKTKIYTNNITIPQTKTPINLNIYDKDQNILNVLNDKEERNVEINGISGVLKYNATSQKHTFTRSLAGNDVQVSALTPIKIEEAQFNKDSIAIIFTGSYDPNVSNGIFRTITYQRAIISQLNTQKYIVVSLTSKRKFPIVDDMNNVLKQEHGDHFLDFRSYLLENGLKDANITPTNQDNLDLQKRYIPSSLLKTDKLNGNNQFNELLAKQLIQKMTELGYIDKNDIK